MEGQIFSLEDEDYDNMFITQEPSQIVPLPMEMDNSDDENGMFLGLKENDFTSPVTSQFIQIFLMRKIFKFHLHKNGRYGLGNIHNYFG